MVGPFDGRWMVGGGEGRGKLHAAHETRSTELNNCFYWEGALCAPPPRVFRALESPGLIGLRVSDEEFDKITISGQA